MRWISVLMTLGVAFLAPMAVASEQIEFNRDVRPILAEACLSCHGADSASREAGLRLDQREDAIDMGAISPGDPDLSEMIRRVLSDDPDEIMPPPHLKKELTEEQKQILVRWVKEGAEYQPHWSFISPQKPELPEVQQKDWVRNPIDQFVLAGIEAAGLQPAPEADRRTLARRVSLDLTGLPPAPEVVEAYLADTSPKAYENLVESLLNSVTWGEHRGRYWLDYARYADTHGIHFDNYREMWSYRDWVINAFNQNMPFDQFTIENLAGDLLPDATLDQQIASGFNRCNMTTNEGGVIAEEYLVLYTRDRIETTSLVWLGLTAGCAVCHTHKFDPISQHEFYEMAAFFNNTTQRAMDGNVKDTPPIVTVPTLEDRARFNEVTENLKQSRSAVAERRQTARTEFDEWLKTISPDEFNKRIPTEGLALHLPLDSQNQESAGSLNGVAIDSLKAATWEPTGITGSESIKIGETSPLTLPDFGDFDASQPFSCAAWVRVDPADETGAVIARMDGAQANYRGWDLYLEGRRVGMHLISSWSGDAIKVMSRQQIPADQWVHVAYTYDGSRKAEGVKVYIDGVVQDVTYPANQLTSNETKADVPFTLGQRSNGDRLNGIRLNDVRVFERALSAEEMANLGPIQRLASTLTKKPDEREVNDVNAIYEWWLKTHDTQFQQQTQTLAKLEQEERDIKQRGTIAHVMHEKMEDAVAYVLARGEYDKREDQVSPNTPRALPAFPEDYPKNRLGFAKWLLLPDHPLTARVTVNRFWQEVFGTGIVKTSGDFGIMGELPSHPELLDWMALEFIDSGWDVKELFRTIVLSSTYRQSAATTPEKIEKDPANRLLARGPRFRMDAEMIRDYALAASGELVPIVGGPSVKPYQPDGVWEAIAMGGSNTGRYQKDTDSGLYRRSLYTFVKRMAPPATMEIFNAPNREFCVTLRERTNTPLQALAALNDEQFVEAARYLAEQAIKNGGDDYESRLSYISSRLVCRDFQPNEQEIIRSSFEKLFAYYQQNPEDAKLLMTVGESKADDSLDVRELAAWTMLTNQLMNLDEVLNK